MLSFNGMGRILSTTMVPGTGASAVNRQILRPQLKAANTPVGRYAVGAMITVAGRARYAYAPERLTVIEAEVPPSIAAILNGQNILLSWTTNAPGYALQWTTNVATGTWNDTGSTPEVINGRHVVTQDAAAGDRFFRLKK